MIVTQADILIMEKELTQALSKRSGGKLSLTQSNNIAHSAIANIDFNNSALMHKGVNWIAKQIIDIIDFEEMDV